MSHRIAELSQCLMRIVGPKLKYVPRRQPGGYFIRRPEPVFHIDALILQAIIPRVAEQFRGTLFRRKLDR
jgi:hypothetical protein